MKRLLIFLICLLAMPAVYAQTEPSVTFDPNTGNYIIRYQGLDGNLVETIFEPATKIEPGVEVTVLVESGLYRYQYAVHNGSSSEQRVLNFSVQLFTAINSITKPNQEWRTGMHSSPVAVYWSHTLRDPSGLYTPYDGIAPDSIVSGFSFRSSGLPAIVTSNFRGNAPLSIVFPDEPPAEISNLLRPLRQFPANTVQSETIGPKDPPVPFVAVVFLDTLISYTAQSLALGWIADQLTADKYTNLFSTARSQLMSNDSTGARSTLTTVLNNVPADSAAELLTSEAYALLRYNTEYLLDQLPEQSSGIAVLATHSIWLEQNAEILSGSVAVNESGDPPFLDSQVALSVGIGSSIAVGCDLKANSIKVKQNATVAGNVYYNELTNNGSITGALNTPLSLPVVPTLPPFQSATPGGENITLAQNEEQTLAPGDYGDIVVRMGGKLIFTGGIYNLRSLNCGDNTKLVFHTASQVRIADKFETGQGSSLGPETGAPIRARDIVFYVAGINGANGNLGATPKAAKVGLSNTVFANFYVPNGTLWLRQGSVVEGAFIGKDVDVGIGVQVSLNSAW